MMRAVAAALTVSQWLQSLICLLLLTATLTFTIWTNERVLLAKATADLAAEMARANEREALAKAIAAQLRARSEESDDGP